MYVKKIVCKNVGPIKQVSITPSYTTENNPKPIVFVGENGAGKSTIISNIVDSFYEMARNAYNNACETSEGSGYQYYKAILPNEVHTGAKGMFSCIQYEDDNDTFTYFYISGLLNKAHMQWDLDGISLDGLSWNEKTNYKGITINKEQTKTIFI